jgi:hypothetical protein
MRRFVRNYSLSLVLAALFLGAWVLQTVLGWYEFKAEQVEHGQAAAWFGAEGYIWNWGRATFENWQSEFLQLLTFVVLTSVLIHKGSHESKDSDERLQAAVDRIEHRLAAMQRTDAGAAVGQVNDAAEVGSAPANGYRRHLRVH